MRPPATQNVHIFVRSLRVASIALVAALLTSSQAFAAACAKAPKAPAKGCAKAIVDDWFPDADLDRLYPLDCYQKAIDSLGADALGYSSAPEDILRAQRFARRGCADPGRNQIAPTTDSTDTTVTTETTTDTGGSAGPGPGGDDDSSSVPVPLIVLGGLAVLLLAAGGAGYASRRLRGPQPPEDDPASAQ